MNYIFVLQLIFNIYQLILCADEQKIKLNNGVNIPVIGLGTAQGFGEQSIQAVKDALAIGYRLIDTAQIYMNERDIGQALVKSIDAGVVKREDVFITTKVYPWFWLTENSTLDNVHNSLKDLNTTYLDLVLIHWPYNDYKAIYRGLESAYDQKLIRAIGVSNFEANHLEDLISVSKVKPAVNQIEIHPKKIQENLVDYCKKNDIVVMGYSPLGLGSLINDPMLMAIAENHNKTSAQVMIKWQIQRQLIPIPKSVNKKRIEENFNVFDFTLTDAEMYIISVI